jgi:hypothetical protein
VPCWSLGRQPLTHLACICGSIRSAPPPEGPMFFGCVGRLAAPLVAGYWRAPMARGLGSRRNLRTPARFVASVLAFLLCLHSGLASAHLWQHSGHNCGVLALRDWSQPAVCHSPASESDLRQNLDQCAACRAARDLSHAGLAVVPEVELRLPSRARASVGSAPPALDPVAIAAPRAPPSHGNLCS